MAEDQPRATELVALMKLNLGEEDNPSSDEAKILEAQIPILPDGATVPPHLDQESILDILPLYWAPERLLDDTGDLQLNNRAQASLQGVTDLELVNIMLGLDQGQRSLKNELRLVNEDHQNEITTATRKIRQVSKELKEEREQGQQRYAQYRTAQEQMQESYDRVTDLILGLKQAIVMQQEANSELLSIIIKQIGSMEDVKQCVEEAKILVEGVSEVTRIFAQSLAADSAKARAVEAVQLREENVTIRGQLEVVTIALGLSQAKILDRVWKPCSVM